MSFACRLSLCSLALSLIFINPTLAQSQSSSSVPGAPPSPAESAVRAVVEKYFTSYGVKDLTGLISMWSEKSPDYASYKQSLQDQFVTEDYSLGIPAISQLKVEGEQASLRATADLTAISLKSRQKREQRMVRNFAFVREDGKWKIWRNASAEDDLAEALAQAKTEAERDGLLAEEKELMTVELAQALNSQGRQYFIREDYPRAFAIYHQSQKMAEQIGYKAGLADALLGIGEVYSAQGDFAPALALAQRGLRLHESSNNQAGVATAMRNIGLVYYRLDDYTQALDYLRKSMTLSEALNDKSGIARALSGIGSVLAQQGDAASALEFYQKSLALNDALNNNRGIASNLYNIGNIYYDLSNYVRALEYYHKSITLADAIKDQVSLSATLNGVGNIYLSQGDYEQALKYFREGLALSENVRNKELTAVIIDNIGYVLDAQGDYAQALDYLQKSLALRQSMGGQVGAARTLKNIGYVFYHQADYAQALGYFQKSLTLREAAGDKNGISVSLSSIGKVHHKQGRHELAVDYAERSAALARQIGETEVLWRARLTSGAAYLALKDPGRAREAFEEAISTVETLRADVAGGEGELQSFFASKVPPYHAMVDLLISQGRPDEALTFAERAKSRVLLDVLQSGRVNVTKAMTAQEQEQERKLNVDLVALNNQISRETALPQPDQARLTELKAQLQIARLDFEAFQTNLYAIHPELRAQRGEAQPFRLEETAALLPNATSALLEYVVTDDKTYLFAITKAAGKTKTDIRVYTLPVKRDELTRQTEDFRRQLAGRDLGFRGAAAKLYDLLLKPAQAQLRGKTSLIIVPDDKLWDLPFQALLAAPNRFMIENASIAYAPSLTVLREMMNRRRNQRGGSGSGTLLALGNPALGKETIELAALTLRDEKLDPLPEAEKEVKALGQLYGNAHSKVYIGADAREDRLKAEAAQARVLHLATHGVLNNASPMYSHLVLAQGDKNEDGLVEAWELMRLDLKADLAVLSACETARGRFGAGEGMIGLTWAMFIAGVPSTMVSQWKVESASTRDLMLAFHRRLQAPRASAKLKPTKAEALRQATLKVMKNPETSHPFYWAGFVLVGADR
jgi:CHAT domain-containing protein/tetratricopeptide (TPR) repeat protein